MTGRPSRVPAVLFRCTASLALVTILVVASSTAASAGIDRRPSSSNAPGHERKVVIQRAKSQRGAPYRSGGTSPSGFDCSGFTHWIFEGHGANLPHSAAAQYNLGTRPGYKRVWSKSHLKKGDLVFFNTNGYSVSHAGMYIGGGRFISASSHGVRVDSIYDPYYWGHRYVGATRLPVFIHGEGHGGDHSHHAHHRKAHPSWHRGKHGW
ncbi:MAG: C40 family peptidase [Actinomycetota bacterium]|nr:C40 family peptidase [Actinomycetota bacterium]